MTTTAEPAPPAAAHPVEPAGNVDRFLAFWQGSVKDKVNKQPGLADGIFYRGIDAGGPFQFIDVARRDKNASRPSPGP